MTSAPTSDDRAAASLLRAARREYEAAATAYDARWAAYTRRTLALLHPLVPPVPGRLLDVGCGTGSLAAALAGWDVRPESYVGVDVAPAMLTAAGAKTEAAPFPCALVAASAGELPLAAASFDTAVSASSLHRWPDVGAGLAELRRVLRPGGRVVLLDWSADHLSVRAVAAWLRLARGTRVRPMGSGALAEALRGAGFTVGPVRRTRISAVWGVMTVEAAR